MSTQYQQQDTGMVIEEIVGAEFGEVTYKVVKPGTSGLMVGNVVSRGTPERMHQLLKMGYFKRYFEE